MALRLADVLVEMGAVKRDALAAYGAEKGSDAALASALLQAGVLDERALCAAFARVHEHPVVALETSTLDLSALDGLPKALARQHALLPVAFDDESVTVLTGDAGSRPPIIQELEFALARPVQLYAALPTSLTAAIESAYYAREQGAAVLRGSGASAAAPFLDVVRPPPPTGPVGVAALMRSLSEPFATLRRVAEKSSALPMPTPVMPAPPAGEGAKVDAAAIPEGEGPVVVVVEDDEAIRTIMARALKKDGCRVVEVGRGDEALRAIWVARPALAVLDAMLPGLHGFEICKRLKSHAEYRAVPVLMVTAVYRELTSVREMHEVLGADAFLEKPFPLATFRKLAAELLGRDVQLPPLRPEIIERLGALQVDVERHRAMGDAERAEAAARRLVELAPLDAVSHLELGNVHMDMGKHEEALKSYREATVLDPLLFSAWANLAQVYELLGFVRMARQAWVRAAQLAPDSEQRARIEQHVKSTP